jgi:hypothetical protein
LCALHCEIRDRTIDRAYNEHSLSSSGRNQMAAKEPVDTKAVIFTIFAAIFIIAVSLASLHATMGPEGGATPTQSAKK